MGRWTPRAGQRGSSEASGDSGLACGVLGNEKEIQRAMVLLSD
ncbi:MAG: hypothetical protein Q8Q09_13655 [Deltaproteobacteria bacterium]|nr:hypothetical protein [Deltaproteobacteria bacterium]